MLKLGSIFQDGAVLQQQKLIPVWGVTDPGSQISIEFAGHKSYGKSSMTGKFMMRLPSVNAGGPYTLSVYNETSGEKVVLNDILVGEVWLASGQSNMSYRLNSDIATGFTEDENKPFCVNRQQESEYCSQINDADKLRFITVEAANSGIVEDDFSGQWQHMTAENAPSCSAVGAWFGKYLQEKLDIPVGIIVSAVGGTVAESWTSREGLMSNPDTVGQALEWDALRNDADLWQESFLACGLVGLEKYADPGNKGLGMGYADLSYDDSEWREFRVPGSWIRQKIAGNGVIWARKYFDIPAEHAGKKFVARIGAVDKSDITYCNGVEIGRTGKDFDTTAFNVLRNYEIPAGVLKAGRNVIAVRAYSFIYDGAFTGRVKNFSLESEDGNFVCDISGVWQAVAEVDYGTANSGNIRLGPGNSNTPAILFGSMINPLIPYAMRGVIWYQGESNAKSMADSYAYMNKLKTMINDWRYRWGQGDFPFIQVQLANYYEADGLINENSSWALLRDTQRTICDQMKNVYMASAIDIGEAGDIHPQDKKSVGCRLARNAFANVYHLSDIVPCGPMCCGYEIMDGRIRINFKNAAGLKLKGELPFAFAVSGYDRIFIPAENVEIDGDSVIVSSSRVKEPVTVRYAWGNNPVSSLYNADDLPASSFRLDDWPLSD